MESCEEALQDVDECLVRQKWVVVEQGSIRRDSSTEKKIWVMVWECISPLLLWIVRSLYVYLD